MYSYRPITVTITETHYKGSFPPPQVIRERGGPAFKEGEEGVDQPVATAADQEDHGEGGGGAPDK